MKINVDVFLGGTMDYLESLEVKNFGPINEAKINISPLTVFVGKNSSGKSFLSSLIHSLSNPFKHNIHRFPAYSLNYLLDNNPELLNDFETKLENYLKSEPSFTDKAFSYPLKEFIRLIDEGFGKCYTKSIENELKNNWKTNLNHLNRMNQYPFEIKYDEITFVNDNGKLVSYNFSNKIKNFFKTINFINPIGVKISTDENKLYINFDYSLWMKMYGDDESISIGQLIYVLVVNKLIKELQNNSFYIPVGGEIFKDFNAFMVNEVKGVIDSSTIEKEFLTNLLKVNEATSEGYFYNLACELENDINKGEIQIKNGELKDEIVFIDEKNNIEFDLNLISSSVHELIPIIIYLKYYLNKGDILILEEIENHLHPENQLILVKYLVKALNQGLNIILTTHSDYILEKFNNLIQLGNCKKEVFTHLNYDESCILDYRDISIYNFKKNDDYSYTPHMIDVNFTGFSEDNFSHVIDELYNESDIMDEFKIR